MQDFIQTIPSFEEVPMAVRRVTLRPRVVTARDVRADASLEEDPYLGKVSRYIPSEIVAAYIAASGIVLGSEGMQKLTWLWIVIAVLGILTPVWLYFATKVEGKPPAVFQIVVGIAAYLVWVFALSGGDLFPNWYNATYGGLLLILFTLIVPIVEKILNQ
jgi:MFS superfamily sulfate permease-like transporter